MGLDEKAVKRVAPWGLYRAGHYAPERWLIVPTSVGGKAVPLDYTRVLEYLTPEQIVERLNGCEACHRGRVETEVPVSRGTCQYSGPCPSCASLRAFIGEQAERLVGECECDSGVIGQQYAKLGEDDPDQRCPKCAPLRELLPEGAGASDAPASLSDGTHD
jgi:hypothetical protein